MDRSQSGEHSKNCWRPICWPQPMRNTMISMMILSVHDDTRYGGVDNRCIFSMFVTSSMVVPSLPLDKVRIGRTVCGDSACGAKCHRVAHQSARYVVRDLRNWPLMQVVILPRANSSGYIWRKSKNTRLLRTAPYLWRIPAETERAASDARETSSRQRLVAAIICRTPRLPLTTNRAWRRASYHQNGTTTWVARSELISLKILVISL